MSLDVTTLALAVDSSQVSTANTVLDKFAAAGERAEGASARLAKASADHGRAINTQLVPAANKGALAFKTLAEAQAALGPAAAAQLQAAGAFGAIETKANAAAAAVHRLGDEAQAAAGRTQAALAGRPARAIAPGAVTSDPGAVNALSTALTRADSQAARLGTTLARDVAAGATVARTSLGDLSTATTSLGASSFVNFDKVSTSLGATAAKADEATLAVHRLRNEIALTGPLASATTSLGAVTGPANRPAAGLRGAVEQRDVEEQARRAADPRLAFAPTVAANPAAVRPVVAGNEAVAKSAKLAAFQQQQLGFQLHDFFVQVASGSSPLTAFIQQGSQLSGTFGGAGNAFRAVTALITPMRAAIGAAALAVGGLVLVLARAESAARDLATVQAQLAGTGRSDLFSTAELKAFINELALAPGVTRDTATAIVSELSKVHDIGGGLFKDLGKLAADYAKATGTDIPTAAKALGKAFADPERGAKQLDDALGSLTSTQLLQIESLTRQGNVAGAQRVLYDALKSSVKGLADDAMTPLQKSVNDLGNSWERALQQLDRSEGLRTLNTLLAKTVEFVDFLVRNADKVGGLGNIPISMIPGLGGPAALANALPAGPGLFSSSTPKNPTASGRITNLAGGAAPAAAGSAGAVGPSNADDEIKRAIGAAKAYQSQKGQLAELADERKRFNSALQQSVALYGKESEQAKKLRDAIAGVDEKAAAVKKRGSGGGNEPQQVLDAQLEQRLKASRDILERERDTVAFQQRFLQGEYQAGQKSLIEFYDGKRAAIERGTAAELAELEKERAAVEKHLADTKRTSPKDKSALERDQTRLNEIDAQAEKARLSGSREIILSDQQKAEALKQLSEQVLNFQASLKQLAGDETGAARIRAQLVDIQEASLAAQSAKSGTPISAAELANAKALRQTQIDLTDAKDKTSAVNQRLAIEEDRIALAMRTGAIGEIEAMQRAGAARSKVAAELEKIVQAQEEIASRAENSKNWQLQLDTSRARLELEKLKAEIDPLKDKFDGMLKDAGGNFLNDLMNGAKPKDALKSFFGSISREINSMVSKEIAGELFGKNGALGGAGGFLAKIFGGKPDTAVSNTPQQSFRQSEITAQNAAGRDAGSSAVVDAKTAEASASNASATAINDLATAARSAAAALNEIASRGTGGPAFTGPAVPALGITGRGTDNTVLPTGDFARMDRGQTGETAVMGMFKEAEKSGAQLASVNDAAATSILQFASAAARGGDAMSMLPSIINMIQAAAAMSSASGGGGGFIGALGSLFSTGSMNAAGGFNSLGFGSGAGFGNMDLGLFLHSGGIVGKTSDHRPVPRGVFADAGKYHGGGMVGGAKEPKLAANEVPAILMGGPKGRREEVLTASDPRHRDNIAPALLHVIERAPGAAKLPQIIQAAMQAQVSPGRALALSIVGGRGGAGGAGGKGGDSHARAIGGAGGRATAVAGAAGLRPGEVPAILLRNEEVITAKDPRHRDRLTPDLAGAFTAAPRYHTGGIAGLRPDRTDVLKPVRNPYLNAVKEADKAKAGGDSYITVQVNATPGMTREQAMNQGRDIGRGLKGHARQRTRND